MTARQSAINVAVRFGSPFGVYPVAEAHLPEFINVPFARTFQQPQHGIVPVMAFRWVATHCDRLRPSVPSGHAPPDVNHVTLRFPRGSGFCADAFDHPQDPHQAEMQQ